MISTEAGLQLERLRRWSQSELMATRCDPTLTPEQKRERIATIRHQHAERARALITEGTNDNPEGE